MANTFKGICAVVGGVLGGLVGGLDGLLYALLIFMAIDIFTGVMVGISQKKINSNISFKGLCKKGMVLALVVVGNLLDTKVIGTGSIVRTAVIMFYLAHEGLSITENAGKLGLPLPEKLVGILEQLKSKSEETEE